MTPQSFWAWAETEPDRPCLLDADQPRSFGDLAADAHRATNAFRAAGLAPRDVICVQLPNQPLSLVVNLAVGESGVQWVPASAALVTDEIAYLLEDSGAKAVLVDATLGTAAAEAALARGIETRWCVNGDLDGFERFEDVLAASSDSLPPDRQAGGPLFYTSGTTGRPKAVSRTAGPPVSPEVAGAGAANYAGIFGLTSGDDVHIVSGPMYHAAPLGWAMNALHLGHSIVIPGKWDAERWLASVERNKVTYSFMVPTHFQRLLELPDEVRATYDTSSLKKVVHAAAPCPPEVKRRMLDWLGPIVWEFYAGTEGGGTTATAEDWLRKPGTVGTSWPGSEIHILDDDGNQLPAGEAGAIWIKSFMGTFEYKGAPEKTAESRRGDLFTIGDIGYLDDEGYLFLLDRRTDLIITGGVNVYPAEIEGVLAANPKVADAAVFGLPDPQWGQRVVAVVQPAPGVLGDDALRVELLADCTEKLAKVKLPKQLDFRSDLPRRDNGKLVKRILRDEYLAAES